jgi:hypothetical protein
MMAHLLDALEAGTDIGHYGRLTFAMVARHFMSEDMLVRLPSAVRRPPPPAVADTPARAGGPGTTEPPSAPTRRGTT